MTESKDPYDYLRKHDKMRIENLEAEVSRLRDFLIKKDICPECGGEFGFECNCSVEIF